MELLYDRFVISANKSLLKIDTICGFLARSYWANKRSLEMIEKSINNSVCFGVYDGDKQVDFARVVTDFATMYYLFMDYTKSMAL